MRDQHLPHTPPPPGASPSRPGHRAGTGRPAATPATVNSDTGTPTVPDWLTVTEVSLALRVPRATFYRWRQHRLAPPAVRLPNGQLRIHRADLLAWLTAHREPAAPEPTPPTSPHIVGPSRSDIRRSTDGDSDGTHADRWGAAA